MVRKPALPIDRVLCTNQDGEAGLVPAWAFAPPQRLFCLASLTPDSVWARRQGKQDFCFVNKKTQKNFVCGWVIPGIVPFMSLQLEPAPAQRFAVLGHRIVAHPLPPKRPQLEGQPTQLCLLAQQRLADRRGVEPL